MSQSVRVALLTALAMLAFAANSVLARLALGVEGADPLFYTCLRLVSGALVLLVLLRLQGRSVRPAGNWRSAAALLGYALAFSLAYLLLGAGAGALILFATVQLGMVGWAVIRGDRPGALEWLGLALALGGFVWLVAPGLVAPDPLGAALMIGSGLCWAAYSLLGRGSSSPLIDTAGNFLRTLPVAVLLLAIGWVAHPPSLPTVTYAVLSGAVASGLGYAIWYAALPDLSRTRAAVVQLSVPVIAAIGGVLLIAEPLTPRLVLAALAIVGGIALAALNAARRRT